MAYPQILHHGAAHGVTGSCHQLLLDNQHSLLIDCGLFQGAETSADGLGNAEQLQIGFDTRNIRALVATHVHVDHIGRLPQLLAAGFKGPILCSEPSARLLPLVLEDAFRLGVSRDAKLLERYLSLIGMRTIALPYKTWFSIVDDPQLHARIRLQRAGHILGSAYVECDLRYRSSGEKRRIVFSGDLGATHTPLLPAPKSPWKADTLVLESTYGDRRHASRANRRRQLQAVIEKALVDNGSVLIPAFSIGRTQELLYELEDIIHRMKLPAAEKSGAPQDNPWPGLPIVLDSPLASRFTEVYQQLQPYWDKEALRRVGKGRNPLGFANLITVDSHSDHLSMVRHLAQSGRPAIVIAASGMCAGGRIVDYLKAMLGDRRHNVVFVGYQAKGTPGQAIQQYGPRGGYVDLDGERIDIRAGVETLGGYSAHADQQGLVSFVTRMRHWPSEIRLVHGEDIAKRQLARALQEQYRQNARTVTIETGL
ncbi:Metallo-beta-lactamase family protein, RNA-specific [Pseudomonas sp. OF001]|uniref:MBL fold metallo-hydrolase n=1 Tax=unclassified Pseudomonas TaxID=196821 RepID=UPI0010A665D1|nr:MULTISPECIES: MBL fold metallo-hydrolase [unclassified Pseudomonas]THG87309.1 MBL fold metallo-hydrolase [Pseudomonas sp. A-1]CAD5377027.1 Metallo-beta-lactamase family protein, RNA-specific [Pseudomonas sp. OF001]